MKVPSVFVNVLTALSVLQSSTALPFINTQNVLIKALPPGGANPVLSNNAAKIAGALAFTEGTYMALAPSLSLKMHGVDEVTNPTNMMILRRTGLCILNLGVYVYCLIFNDFRVQTPFAINALLFIADSLSSLMNQDSKTIGPSNKLDLSFLAVTGSAAYAALNDLECFNPLFKAFSVYTTICGILDYFAPQQAIKLFESEEAADADTPGVVHIIGNCCLVLGTLTASLAWGVDATQAVGYSALASAILDIKSMFFTPEVEAMDMNKYSLMVGPLWNAGIAAAILI